MTFEQNEYVRTAALVAIQKAVLAYLKQSKEEFKDSFVEELTHAQARIDANGTGRVGTWLLEKHGEGLRLIRHPERSAVMYLFYATLTHSDGHWRVTHFDHERVVAR